jgi:hypothetical protein
MLLGRERAVCKMKQMLPQFHSPLSCYVHGYCVGEDDQLCGLSFRFDC